MNIENPGFHGHLHSETGTPVLSNRLRSEGVLSREQINWCKDNKIAIAFDPVQIGWIAADCIDDLAGVDANEAKFTFRPWSPQDASTLAELLSSERLWQYLPEDSLGSLDETTALQLIELGGEAHHEVRAVELNGVPIGQVRLHFGENDQAEVSYWLGESYWGKGYASLIVRAFCDRSLRDHPEITCLFARVHKQNPASERVLDKASFVQSGRDGDWNFFERRRA